MGLYRDIVNSVSIDTVASNLGMDCNKQKTRFGPCPSCRADRTSRKDSRPPVGVVRGNTSDGWTCFSCNASGSILDLVSYHQSNVDFKSLTDKTELKEFFKTLGYASREVFIKKKDYVPTNDLRSLWESIKENPCSSRETPKKIDEFFAHRGIWPSRVNEAFVFPHNFHYNTLTKVETNSGRMMPFWPWKWANEYPICIPLVNTSAQIKSFQGRSCELYPTGNKTMCPKGFSMDGLFFANKKMREFLREETNPKQFWIVEGEMDFLTMTSCSEIEERAVIGIKNGSLSAFQEIKFPLSSEVIIATHNDEAGEKYAQRICKAIYPVVPKRLILEQGDINDYLNDDAKSVHDLDEHVNPFPGLNKMISEKAVAKVKSCFHQLEDASKATRVDLLLELFDITEELAIAYAYHKEEMDKFLFRISAVHGCSKLANKLHQALIARTKDGTIKNEVSNGKIVELVGPDPAVNLIREPIMEKGMKIGEGKIKPCELNIFEILKNDNRLKGKFKLNDFTKEYEVDGEPNDSIQTTKLMLFIQKHYEQIYFTHTQLGRIINYVASENKYHPVQDVLNDWAYNLDMSKAPDHARPEYLFTHYYRAKTGKDEYNELIQEYGKVHCLNFVMRQFEPGCECQLVPICIGPQNLGKSICTQILGIKKEFFGRGKIDFNNKDSKLILSGCALYDLDECASLVGQDYETMKSFITNPSFKIRRPYEAGVTTVEGSWVLMGNTNVEALDFLSDPTGSRRFMAFRVGLGGMCRIDELREDLKYIYARAMHSYLGIGEYEKPNRKNWFTPEIRARQESYNKQFATTDPWLPHITSFIRLRYKQWSDETKRQYGLDGVSRDEWVDFIQNFDKEHKEPRKLSRVRKITVKDIMESLGIPIIKQDRKLSLRISNTIAGIGCKPSGQIRMGKSRENAWEIPMDFEIDN